jgi:hypothetical protein
MYQPHCNLEDKYLILKESHSNLKQLRHYKRECNICPMNFAGKSKVHEELQSYTDVILDIKDLMLMFRLPEDYYTELCKSRSLNIVVQSILSLPWLSLKHCQVNTSPFHFVHKQWMQTAKSMVMRDRQLHDHTGRYLSTPYLNAKANRSEQDSNTGQLLKYFMTVKMSHPISDIPFRTLSFTSSLVNSVFVGQGNTYADMSSFSDLVDFSYVCRDFMAYREQFVPGITCLVHLELCVIPLQNTISFSALVYLPESRDIKQSENRKVQHEQYVTKIQVNDDVRVTLLFKSSKMPVNIGGISQTEASFTYNKSSHQEERKTLNGFSLSEAYVELFMEPRKSNSGSRDNGYTFNRAGGVPETIVADNYTINNTQNNYYFPEIRDHPESGINNLQPDVQLRETRAYCDKHNDLNHPYQTQDLAGRSHHASEYGDSYIDYGYHSHTGKNGFNETNNRPNKNRSTNKPKTPKSGRSGSMHLNSQIQKGASKSSDEGMSEENQQNNLKLLPTVGDLIKDSKLLKSYANSKSKGIVLQNLLADLKDDQVPQLLTTLTPVIKDICKNKHGNYFAQTAIKMLPANCIADYLKLVSLANLAAT